MTEQVWEEYEVAVLAPKTVVPKPEEAKSSTTAKPKTKQASIMGFFTKKP